MSLNDFIQVSVSLAATPISTLGFGTALVLTPNAPFAGRVKTYYDMLEVAVDFPDTYCAERLAMGALFAQSASLVKMGKCTNAPTMRYKVSAITPTSFHTTDYALRVIGEEFDAVVAFTSDSDATDAEFATALVTALNSVSGKNYTASGSASPVTVTATAAGDFFSIEVLDRSLMTLEIDHADPGVTADLNAILAADGDFASVIGTQLSTAMIASISIWANTNQKIFLFDTPDTDVVGTALAAASDPIDIANTANRKFSSGWFHPSPANFLAAAVNGACLPLAPGSETWAYKQLSGVETVVLTPAERANLVAKNGNSYESVRGTPVTFNGRTAGGSWIDLQRAILWAIDQIQVDFFNFIAQASSTGSKVGFDEIGRVALEGNYKASLKKLITRGLAAEAGSKVTVIPLANVPSGDRANRHYPDTTIAFTALGAIQSGDVRLVIS